MCIFGQRALRFQRMVLSCTPHKTDLFSGLVFPIHEAPCTLAAAAKAAQCRDDAERAPRSERLLIPGAGTGGGERAASCFVPVGTRTRCDTEQSGATPGHRGKHLEEQKKRA